MRAGRDATADDLPWHVSVGVRCNRGPSLTVIEGHRGGGTIVGPRLVITAAHCLADMLDLVTPGEPFELPPTVALRVARGHDLHQSEVYDVVRVDVHPRYD